MKHLPDILALQRNLVKRFQNVAVLTGTIKEFLNAQKAGRATVSGGNRGSLFSGKRSATDGNMSRGRT